MPEIVVTCPHCQAKAKLKSTKMLGKKVNCRSCETPYVLKADGQQKKARAASADEFDDFDEEFDSAAVARARRARKRKGSPAAAPAQRRPNPRVKNRNRKSHNLPSCC